MVDTEDSTKSGWGGARAGAGRPRNARQTLSDPEPWVTAGISRATWYRQSRPQYMAAMNKANNDANLSSRRNQRQATAAAYVALYAGIKERQVWIKPGASPTKRLPSRFADPDAKKHAGRQSRARRLRAPGTHSAADIRDIRRMQGDGCAGCQCPLQGKGDIDHIVPIAKGGANTRRNLQLLCKPCNSSKHDRDPIEWMRSKGFLL